MKDLDAIHRLEETVAAVRKHCVSGERVVFVSGDFNIVHPGHLRLLNYAAGLGDRLVVGVNADGLGNTHVLEDHRVEGVASIGIVSHAFVLHHRPEEFIKMFQPVVVVKGREYAILKNPEQDAVESYGGKLLFSSGHVRFSSLDLLQREVSEGNLSTILHAGGFAERHGFEIRGLQGIVEKFSSLNVVVIGDLIVDEFVTCDALGMSQEDPTVVVTPIKTDRFVGGAGIVAAHARSLGADAHFFTVSGGDEVAGFATRTLAEYGVKANFLVDGSRPTTVKRRYRASGKTLLRVNHLSQQDISQELLEAQFENICPALDKANLLIFSDFSYGCLPQPLVEQIMTYCAERGVIMAADSQSSSQVGDIGRFKGVDLVTPTEREARLATRDFHSGLVVLADNVLKHTGAGVCFITLGQEGMLAHMKNADDGGLVTDRLPAMNPAPVDVSGAGDSLLTFGAMGLAAGASVWQAAYLGSIAAACQVSRLGNKPLNLREIVQELFP